MVKIRIGMLGVAHVHAETYIKSLRSNEKVEFLGVFDRNLERLHELQEKYAIPTFSNPELLLQKHLQVVLVCSENMNHVQMIRLAARHGVDVLCEKPLAASIADLQEILLLEKQSGIRVMTAFPNRYIHAYKKLKHAYDADAFGTILGIKATNKGEMPGSWFIDKNLSGGGCLIDHTVHVADLLNNLFDSVPCTVNAYAANRLYPELEVEDVALVNWVYPNGISVTLDSSWSRMSSYPYARDLTMHVIGSKDSCRIDYFAESYTIFSSDNNKAILHYYGEDKDQKMLEDLILCYQKGWTFPISSICGCKSALVALAAQYSVKVGRPVEMQELLTDFLKEALL
jgi:predicted dehydrogenase